VNFIFNSGIIGPLYVIAILFQNPKALTLLETNPRRGGAWDRVSAVKAATVIMNIEERAWKATISPNTRG
jgi:hypothetical protein